MLIGICFGLIILDVSRTGPKSHKIRTAQPSGTSRPEGGRVRKKVFLVIAVFLVCVTSGGATAWATGTASSHAF
jgi:hypothetical protein